MKKLRPFLALLLACWLLAVPALADDEISGDTSESSSVSDGVENDSSFSSEESSSEDPPASEDTSPEEEDPPSSSDDTSSFPDDTSSSPEGAPPVVDGTPDTSDPDPVDPNPENPIPEVPDPVDPDLVDPEPVDPEPVDPLPENPVPEVPGTENPLPENPVPETPVDPLPETPVPELPVEVPDVPLDPLPTYPVPDTSVVDPGLQGVPGEVIEVGIDEEPSTENHQIFTITTIPEFALALMEADSDNAMSQVMRDLFGTYTPRIQTVTTYVDGEPTFIEEQYVSGVAGMDWEWIAGVTVFLLLIYCLFRLLGGAVKYG